MLPPPPGAHSHISQSVLAAGCVYCLRSCPSLLPSLLACCHLSSVSPSSHPPTHAHPVPHTSHNPLARHLHVTVSQGFGGLEARLASAAHAYASPTTSFIDRHGSFSLCNLTTTILRSPYAALLFRCTQPHQPASTCRWVWTMPGTMQNGGTTSGDFCNSGDLA